MAKDYDNIIAKGGKQPPNPPPPATSVTEPPGPPYEIEIDPDWTMRPGVILREMLDYAGLTNGMDIRYLKRATGLDEFTVRGLLTGKTLITAEIAERLATGTQPLAISAQFWMNLERSYRDGLAAGKIDLSDDLSS